MVTEKTFSENERGRLRKVSGIVPYGGGGVSGKTLCATSTKLIGHAALTQISNDSKVMASVAF